MKALKRREPVRNYRAVNKLKKKNFFFFFFELYKVVLIIFKSERTYRARILAFSLLLLSWEECGKKGCLKRLKCAGEQRSIADS